MIEFAKWIFGEFQGHSRKKKKREKKKKMVYLKLAEAFLKSLMTATSVF